ncbi:MAG: hypothetical protein ACR2P3_10870 [Geminicoccaceae bacterium]
MNATEAWRFDLNVIWEGLMLGLDLFGPYADWLWAIPMMWAIAAVSLWMFMAWQQQRSDRAYLAYTSRNLPLLRRIARQRALEVAHSRRSDRF